MPHYSRSLDDLQSLLHSVVIVSQTDDRHCITAYQGRLYQTVWDDRMGQYILEPIPWKM